MRQQGYSEIEIKEAADEGGDLNSKARKLLLNDLGQVWTGKCGAAGG